MRRSSGGRTAAPRRRIRVAPLWIAICLTSAPAFAQQDAERILIDALLEDLSDVEPVQDSFEHTAEATEEAGMRAAVPFVAATEDQLASLPHMTRHAAHAIVEARRTQNVPSRAEFLAGIAELTPEMIEDVLAFTAPASDPPSAGVDPPDMRVAYRIRGTWEQQPRKGFRTGAYRGSRAGVFSRLHVRVGASTEFGVVTEKDPGERSYTDRFGGYAVFTDLGPISRLTIGDFRVRDARGRVFGGDSPFPRGDAISASESAGMLCTPFASAGENGFSRGVAAEWTTGALRTLGFLSAIRRDARIDSTDGTITGFDASGLHRTDTESRRRNSALVRSAGVRALLQLHPGGTSLRIGASCLLSQIDRMVARDLDAGFDGRNATDIGIDADLLAGPVHLEAGGARDVRGGLRVSGACVAAMSPAATIAARGNWRLRQRAFARRPDPSSPEDDRETRDLRISTRVRPHRTLHMEASIEERIRDADAAIQGMRRAASAFHLGAAWRPIRNTRIGFRHSMRAQDAPYTAAGSFGTGENGITVLTRDGTRLDIEYRARTLVFRASVERDRTIAGSGGGGGTGTVVLADISYGPPGLFEGSATLAYFNVGSWDARLYCVDRLADGAFSRVILFGRGYHAGLSCALRPSDRIRIDFSYSQTVQDGVRTLGTGLDEIDGDTRSRISVQIGCRL